MKKKWFLVVAVSTALILKAGSVYAHGRDFFPFKISTTVASGLSYGPNLTAMRERQITFLIRTDKELTPGNVRTSTAGAMVAGTYRSYKVNSDLELEGAVDKGTVEVKMTVGQMDTLLYEWEENYEGSPQLKNLKQQMKKLSFHEGAGFEYTCTLKRDFDYVLLINIGYDPATNKLQDRSADLAEVPRFIKALEGDGRAKTILGNNKSGLPVFITITDGEKERVFTARHPMHEIVWSRGKGMKHYFYQDSIEDVKELPEVKQLAAAPEIKQFRAEQSGPVRLSVKGNPKDGFSFVVVGSDAVRKLAARIENKKVVVDVSN